MVRRFGLKLIYKREASPYKKCSMGEFQQSRLRDDVFGGLVSVSLAIPLAMGYGMFAFTALGDSYFAHGALAGLYAGAPPPSRNAPATSRSSLARIAWSKAAKLTAGSMKAPTPPIT